MIHPDEDDPIEYCSRALAEISPVPDPFRGRILSTKVLLVANALIMMMLPLFFASAMLMLAGFYLGSDEAKANGWQAELRDYAILGRETGHP
jgi:hypothetical protein